MLLVISTATSTTRRTAFTQMDRNGWQRRLPWITQVDFAKPAHSADPSQREYLASATEKKTRLLFARRQNRKARWRRNRLAFSLRPRLRDQPSCCRLCQRN